MKKTGWQNKLRDTGILIALTALALGLGPRATAGKATDSYGFQESMRPWAMGTGSVLTLDYSQNLCPMQAGAGTVLGIVRTSGTTFPVPAAADGTDGNLKPAVSWGG